MTNNHWVQRSISLLNSFEDCYFASGKKKTLADIIYRIGHTIMLTLLDLEVKFFLPEFATESNICV